MAYIYNQNDLDKKINELSKDEQNKYNYYSSILKDFIEVRTTRIIEQDTHSDSLRKIYKDEQNNINILLKENEDDQKLINLLINELCLEYNWDEETYESIIHSGKKYRLN